MAASTFVAGRIVLSSDIDNAYSDIPVALAEGEKVIFAAFGYSSSGGGGNESSVLSVAEFVRPFGPPAFAAVDSLAFDDGTDIDWTMNFTFSGQVSSSSHEVTISYRKNDAILQITEGINTGSTQPFLESTTGGGTGGSTSFLFDTELLLIRSSDGQTLDTAKTSKNFALT